MNRNTGQVLVIAMIFIFTAWAMIHVSHWWGFFVIMIALVDAK